MYYESNRYNADSYSTVITTIERLDKILREYKDQKVAATGKNKVIEVDAVEYAAINTDSIKMDYTTQFYKDYIIGSEGFYSLVVNGYVHKLMNIADHVPYFLRNDDPVFWCKINNDRCIQSCRYFDPECNKRYTKSFSYMPFRSIYVLPQLISLMKSYNREMELDMMIRAFLYSIASSFGEKGNLKNYYTLDHNTPIMALMDRNRSFIIKTLFSNTDFNQVENDVRAAVGLTDTTVDTFENLYGMLMKMYTFVGTNKEAFLKDEDRLNTFKQFVDGDLKTFLIDQTYNSANLVIETPSDFTEYIQGMAKEITNLDNMLMKFPNDLNNLDSLVSGLIKMMRDSNQQMAKLAGGKLPPNPRETLLTSESNLFRRIAADSNLYDFYRQNNRTKLVNSVLFWKWTLAWSFFSGMVLRFGEDHAIQTMTFNEV